MIRTFIALELKNEETLGQIKSFSSRLKQNQPNIKLVKPENLHLTIKFLGDIEESLAPRIYEILNKEINQTIFQGKTYKFKIKGTGQFRKYSILWVKLEGDIGFLQNIKNTVETLLNEKFKIDRDKRTKFKPHLTIGRLKSNKINYKSFGAFKKLINENKNFEFGPFTISEIKLKKSDLTPRGPIYTTYSDNGFL